MINYELAQGIGVAVMGGMMLYLAYKLHKENKLPEKLKKDN